MLSETDGEYKNEKQKWLLIYLKDVIKNIAKEKKIYLYKNSNMLDKYTL